MFKMLRHFAKFIQSKTFAPFSHHSMTDHCGFSGNPDLYGLGIRLSLYIQSLTVAIVATFISQSKYNSFLSNTNLSLFISSWVIILKVSISREARAVELGIFPVLIGSAYAAVAILLKNWNTPKFLWGSTLTTLGTASYWLWFFWSGLDVLPTSGCSRDYAFFFAKVDLYGWYRTLLKVAFIIQLAVYTLFGMLTYPTTQKLKCLISSCSFYTTVVFRLRSR